MNAHDWETFHSFFIAGQFNYWASLLVASGWVGFTISLWHAGFARGLAARLIAVGRTAFSCYILTSLICTFIFYGHGLGLYMHVSRPGQLGVTLGVWIALVAVALIRHQRFNFGPLEWLWRTLTRRASTLPARAPFFARLTPNLNRRFVKRRQLPVHDSAIRACAPPVVRRCWRAML